MPAQNKGWYRNSTWSTKSYLFQLVEAGASSLLLGSPGFIWCFLLLRGLVSYLVPPSSGSVLNSLDHGGYYDLCVCP